MTVEQLVEWLEKSEVKYQVFYDRVAAGGAVKPAVDVTSYRADQSKKDVREIWTPQYMLRFDPASREITYFGEGEFDIRNHEKWVK